MCIRLQWYKTKEEYIKSYLKSEGVSTIEECAKKKYGDASEESIENVKSDIDMAYLAYSTCVP